MLLGVSEVVRLLVFPLVVLLAGAGISGYLIPALTRKRDDYRKALEVKTDLVSDISEVLTEFLISIQIAVLGAPGQGQKAYNEAFRNWEVGSAVIGTKLEAYFPGTTIGEQWTDFSDRVTWFYAITGIDDADRRRAEVDKLLGHYGLAGGDEVARAVSRGVRPALDDQLAWGTLKDAIQGEKSALIRTVLDTDSGALRSGGRAKRAARSRPAP
jgi:hypothetical protein